ncbi:MAG TPA: hypothetical protein VFW94_11835 [Candidatus Acidoferrales bacterium]|nr:hypothetical protein [Candidatus Acidoferrales bacterium]
MRRVIAAVLAILLLCPGLPARDIQKWRNVEKLRRGTTVVVVLCNGGEINGQVEFATDSAVQVAAFNTDAYETSSIQTIDRTSIRRVIRVRAALYVPDQQRWGAIGAVGGGTAGALSAGISYGDGAHAFLGGLAGALLGGLAGMIASAVVMIAQAPRAYFHHPKIVFEARAGGPRPRTSMRR